MTAVAYDAEAPTTTGPALRAARERARVERSEIAERMHVGRQRVVDIEAGATVTPGAEARYRAALAEALADRISALADVVAAAP